MSDAIIIRKKDGEAPATVVRTSVTVLATPKILIDDTMKLVAEEVVRIKVRASQKNGLNKDETEQLKMYVKIMRELIAEQRLLKNENPFEDLSDEALIEAAAKILEKRRSEESNEKQTSPNP